MTRSCSTSRGFTLIELLIAMALAGLVLAAMSGLVNNALG
ncbi:MAG: prepilin-type N-terminal cleavage/methylation domain-containing protein, partial [Gammaproteobacteria bacterium]|nr:prepilin-type N-terminal cleavage/methylation domain-containing protein [Gammaproteobacteria bacterium]